MEEEELLLDKTDLKTDLKMTSDMNDTKKICRI